MGELCQKMERDLRIRNLAPGTCAHYLGCCKRLAAFHMQSPATMYLPEINEYLGYLVQTGISPQTLRVNVAAIRFLFGVTLGRRELAEKIPWPKVPKTKPDILSGAEVEMLLAAITHLKSRVVLTVAYAAGLRLSEACRLKRGDIDSKRMMIHVRLGKGGKDRYVMLGERLLLILREYFRRVRPPGELLFPGREPEVPLSSATPRKELDHAVKRVKLGKKVTPHVLRHSFATHLLELGTDIRIIQTLLGHASIRTTAHYTNVSQKVIASVPSPHDVLGTERGEKLR